MLDWLLDPWSSAIMRRALVEVLLIGAACGPIGVWVTLYRQSYAAESIAHGMLPGLVVAALAGLPLVLGGAAGVLVAAAAIALAGRDERLGPDVGVAVVIGTLFGLGALLALSPEAPPRLSDLLFGDPLGVTGGDLVSAALLAGGVAAVLALGHRGFALAAFDRVAAPSLGVRPGRWDLALLVVLGLGTLAAVQGLGNLLVVALILAPGAAALKLAGSLPAALVTAGALAMAAGVAGLLASYHWELAAGASIAMASIALFVIALAVAARRAGHAIDASRP